MANVSLSRSKHLIPFAALSRQAGQPVDRLLVKAGLPSTCLDDPETLVPSGGVFRFRDLSARTLDLPNIALDATRDLQFSRLGPFGRALMGAPTLWRLLTTFRDHINTQTTITQIELKRLPSGNISFCYCFQHVPPIGIWHSDLYTFRWAIKIIRLVDPSWSPETMWSVSRRSRGHQEVLERLGAKTIDFAHDCTGFLLPSSMLALPLASTGPGTGDACEPDQATATLPETIEGVVGQLIISYADDRWLTITEAAEVLGMSARTLQRRLAAENATYKGVVEQTRSERAGDLLDQTDAPIAEIAARLGYQSQANFTRAFKRWAGTPPSEFRRQRQPE